MLSTAHERRHGPTPFGLFRVARSIFQQGLSVEEIPGPECRPTECLAYPCPCLEVASPWQRAIARARFGPPEPAGGDTVMEAEARLVVARSRGVAAQDGPPVVGSGRRCAQGGGAPRRGRPGVHGGDDHDDDVVSSRPSDEQDLMHGRSIGGVVGLLSMAECGVSNMEESVHSPGEQASQGPYVCKTTRERGMRSGDRVLYHGKHGPVHMDNVHGCVRELVVPLGQLGAGDFIETRDLPRSGEIVALCQDPRCVLRCRHPCDLGGDSSLWSRYAFRTTDVVVRGYAYRSSMCARTCHACGITGETRGSMKLCMGCHALTPYIKSGGTDNEDMVIEDRFRWTPVYCDEGCQEAHWPTHCHDCRRDDVSLHVRACGAFTVRERQYGRVVVIDGVRSRIPWLQCPDLSQPGAHEGWGCT